MFEALLVAATLDLNTPAITHKDQRPVYQEAAVGAILLMQQQQQKNKYKPRRFSNIEFEQDPVSVYDSHLFCEIQECNQPSLWVVNITEEIEKIISSVNTNANERSPNVNNDITWSYSDSGNISSLSLALHKRTNLLTYGFPPRSLRIGFAKTTHEAFLIVYTDAGPRVLNSKINIPVDARSMNLEFVQNPADMSTFLQVKQ